MTVRRGRPPTGRSQVVGPDDPVQRDPAADPEQVARLILLRQLEIRPRTRAQLASTLADRGVPDDAAVRVLDRFEEVGLIDDETFARLWVESRQAGRLLARRALREELRQRGVASETVDSAMQHVSDDQEREAARALVRLRARGMAGLPRPVQVRRLAGALARKGYPAGLSHAVIRDVLGDLALDDDPPGDPDPGADRSDQGTR